MAGKSGSVPAAQLPLNRYRSTDNTHPRCCVARSDHDTPISSYQAYLGKFTKDGAAFRQQQADAGEESVGAREIASDEVCLNYLFVHRDLGGTLGVATMGNLAPGSAAGACAKQPRYVRGPACIDRW